MARVIFPIDEEVAVEAFIVVGEVGKRNTKLFEGVVDQGLDAKSQRIQKKLGYNYNLLR